MLVANSCHQNENSKNGKNCLQTNARSSGATPPNSSPRAKARMQKPQSGGQIFGANPQRCARGDRYGKN